MERWNASPAPATRASSRCSSISATRCWRWPEAPMEDLPPAFDLAPAAPPEREDALQLNLESWEGPLDLLLTLARSQQVDRRQNPILGLVAPSLAFKSGRTSRTGGGGRYGEIERWGVS